MKRTTASEEHLKAALDQITGLKKTTTYAEKLLSVFVRQVRAGMIITYSDVMAEAVAHHRPVNPLLYLIGKILIHL